MDIRVTEEALDRTGFSILLDSSCQFFLSRGPSSAPDRHFTLGQRCTGRHANRHAGGVSDEGAGSEAEREVVNEMHVGAMLNPERRRDGNQDTRQPSTEIRSTRQHS